MAQPYAHPAQPGILFRDPAFLAQVPLSPTTVSQYFSLSPFFARSSTNEQLRMQSLAEPDGGARREPRELEEALRRFRGTEFVVAHAAPQPPPGLGLYVIHQRERWGPAREQTRLVDAFFCLDGNIARAPDLYAVVGNRVVSGTRACGAAGPPRLTLRAARRRHGHPVVALAGARCAAAVRSSCWLWLADSGTGRRG